MRRVNSLSLSQFFRQLGILYQSGISLYQCIVLLENQLNVTFPQNLLTNFKNELAAGKSFSACLGLFPLVFKPFIYELVNLGQQTGKLDNILTYIADYLEQEYFLLKKIKSILFYPTLLLFFSFSLGSLILLFIVPQFEKLFNASNMILPLSTRLLFHFSSFIRTHFIFILLILFLLILNVLLALHYQFFSSLKSLLFHLPIIKHYYHLICQVQFSHHLELAYSAGLSVDKGISLAAESIAYPQFKMIAQGIVNSLKSGHSIYESLYVYTFFPITFCEMIKIGEETGKIDLILRYHIKLLNHAIQHYEHRFQKSLEPALMIGLGIIIGGMLICLYLPIFNLGQAF